MKNQNLIVKKFSDSPDLFPRLCLDVYRDKNRPPLPDGWKVFADFSYFDPISGYFGSCYVKETQGLTGETQCYAIFAHRGTVLDLVNRVSNFIGDLVIALEYVPPQFWDAVQFAKDTYKDLVRKYGKSNITAIDHTGHSLGAVISEIITVYGNFWEIFAAIQVDSLSYSFENPGTKPILQGMIKRNEISPEVLDGAAYYCYAYQADVNLINTYNQQLGTAYQIINVVYDYNFFEKPVWPINIHYLWNLYYIIGNTGDQHRIEKICTAFASGHFGTQEINYSGTLASGYKLYLNPIRAIYWIGYAQEVWKNNPDIHDKFKDFSNFVNDFNAKLAKIYKEAPSVTSAESAEAYTQSALTQKFGALHERDNSEIIKDEDLKDFIIEESNNEKGKSSSKISCNIV